MRKPPARNSRWGLFLFPDFWIFDLHLIDKMLRFFFRIRLPFSQSIGVDADLPGETLGLALPVLGDAREAGIEITQEVLPPPSPPTTVLS